jgi:flagellar basal-body rod modification protein FlgD
MASIASIDSNLVNQINGNPAASSSKGKKDTATELSDNFMTLLVAQLKNQDPLNPMENAEMTSQLAQINTVGGIDKLNETMKGINGQLELGQSIQASALIGKAVLVPGNQVLVGSEGEATPFGVELEEPAATMKATIVDANGIPLQTMDLGPAGKGAHTFNWNGMTTDGQRAPAGAYRVNIQTLNADGGLVESRPLNFAMVNGIVSDGSGAPRLDLGGISEEVAMSDIRKIL